MPFSDIRFLQRAPLMQARRRRIREWLLLALRIAALLLLAFAFARPFFDATGLAGRPVTIVAVDRSFSMSQPGRFERARDEARTAVAAAPPGDLVGLVTFDERARVVAEPTADRAAALAALGRDRARVRGDPLRRGARGRRALDRIAGRTDRGGHRPAARRLGGRRQRRGAAGRHRSHRRRRGGRPQPGRDGARDRPGGRRGRRGEHGRAGAVEHGHAARRRGRAGVGGGHAGARRTPP